MTFLFSLFSSTVACFSFNFYKFQYKDVEFKKFGYTKKFQYCCMLYSTLLLIMVPFETMHCVYTNFTSNIGEYVWTLTNPDTPEVHVRYDMGQGIGVNWSRFAFSMIFKNPNPYHPLILTFVASLVYVQFFKKNISHAYTGLNRISTQLKLD